MYNPESTAPKLTPYDGKDFDVTFFDPEGEAGEIEIPLSFDDYVEGLAKLLAEAGEKVKPEPKPVAEMDEKAEPAKPVEPAAEAGKAILEAMKETERPEEGLAEQAEETTEVTMPSTEEKVAEQTEEVTVAPEEKTAAEEEPMAVTVENGVKVKYDAEHHKEVMEAWRKMGETAKAGGQDWEKQVKDLEDELEKRNREIANLKTTIKRMGVREGVMNAVKGWLTGVQEKRAAKKAEARQAAEIKEAIEADKTLKDLKDYYDNGWELYNRGDLKGQKEQEQMLNALADLRGAIATKEARIGFNKRHLDGKELSYKDAVMGFAKQMLTDGGIYTIIQGEMDQREAGWDKDLSESEKQLKMYEYEEEQYKKAAEIPDPEMMGLIEGRLRNLFYASMNGLLMYKDQQKHEQLKTNAQKDA